MTMLDVFGPYFVADVAEQPNGLFYYYQTLVSGLLALFSAMIAALYLRNQTEIARDHLRQTLRLETERREGQREAARTWLSLHLSKIIRYAETTGASVWTLMQQCEGEALRINRLPFEFPWMPMDAAVAVKEFAEFGDKDEAKFIALMLSIMQVLESRTDAMARSPGARY